MLSTVRFAKCKSLADQLAFVSWDNRSRRVERRKHPDPPPPPLPPPSIQAGPACFHSTAATWKFTQLGEISHLQPFTCAWVNSCCTVAPTFQAATLKSSEHCGDDSVVVRHCHLPPHTHTLTHTHHTHTHTHTHTPHTHTHEKKCTSVFACHYTDWGVWWLQLFPDQRLRLSGRHHRPCVAAAPDGRNCLHQGLSADATVAGLRRRLPRSLQHHRYTGLCWSLSRFNPFTALISLENDR